MRFGSKIAESIGYKIPAGLSRGQMLNNYKNSCPTKKLVIVSIINQIVMFKKCLFVPFLLLACTIVDGQNKDRLHQALSDLLVKESGQGFSGTVLVAGGDQQIFLQSFGYADRSRKLVNSNQTVYDIGSITKQFTAAAILKLEMQGKLQVTDPIDLYLPEFKQLSPPISIHELLTHTAGFPDAIGDDYEAISEVEFIRRAISKRGKVSKKNPYKYSNVGYSLLAIIIERVSGSDYEKYLAEELFAPAGMTYTGYRLPKWDEVQVAHGYRGDIDGGRPDQQNWSTNGPYLHLKGNGGILSTAADLYKWKHALAKDEILSEEAKEKYFKKHVPEDHSGYSYYGYGWAIFPDTGKGELIAHNGGNGYFFADFLNFTSSGHTVIILSNAASRSTEEMARNIAQLL
jgi:CubicO group peptidase (beta-lactamase class C family)